MRVRADRDSSSRASLPSRSHAALDLCAHALAPRGPATLTLHGLDELPQHRLGVAEERVVGGVALVQVALVIGRVDDRLARGNAGGHRMARQAAADAEDEIRLAQVVEDGPRHDHAARAEASG
jgi:hypothetical protein